MRTVKSEIVACQVEQLAGQSTVRIDLATKANGVLLGTIAWEPRWSQYAFTPAHGARYTVKVLRAISRQLDICMRAWERQNAFRRTTHVASMIAPLMLVARLAAFAQPNNSGQNPPAAQQSGTNTPQQITTINNVSSQGDQATPGQQHTDGTKWTDPISLLTGALVFIGIVQAVI